MASFTLTEALRMPGLWRFRRVPFSSPDLGEEVPPGANFHSNTYGISEIRVGREKDSLHKRTTLGTGQALL